ncbi:MAG: hypothetical protein KF894_08930 [Labilithrix sp.]|nr:hypothetical protein [Labilithrix sp.]
MTGIDSEIVRRPYEVAPAVDLDGDAPLSEPPDDSFFGGPEETVPVTRAANTPEPVPLRTLFDIFDDGVRRITRRMTKKETPIELPWPSLHPQFAGGLWPGLHLINSGTGVGKTQFALQIAMHAAERGIPVLYIGLEMNDFDIFCRTVGNATKIPWSRLWTGALDERHVQSIVEVGPKFKELPFHPVFAPPQGYAPSQIASDVRTMRSKYPETDGPGSRPMLVIADYLQIVGDENALRPEDIRIRIGRATGVLKGLASKAGVSVLGISSVAREKYRTLSNIRHEAKLVWELDDRGYPTEQYINDRDAIIGIGKESGETEFYADTNTVLAQCPETRDGKHIDVIVATPKGRASGERWSVLHFNGSNYSEPEDRGGRLIDAWEQNTETREREREERKQAKRQAKEDAKMSRVDADAAAVLAYVKQNPGCSVRQARMNGVGDSAPRWSAAMAKLGSRLAQDTTKKPHVLRVADEESGATA